MSSPINVAENKYFKHLFYNSPQGHFVFSLEPSMPLTLSAEAQYEWVKEHAKAKFINKEFAQMYGFENEDEVIGQSLHHLLASDSQSADIVVHTLIEHKLEWENLTTEEHTLDGQVKFFSSSIQPVIENDHVTALIGHQIDITESTQKEKALEQSESLFRETFENLPVAVTLSYDDGTIGYMNPKFTDMLGYNTDDIKNSDDWFLKVYPDENYRQKAIQSAIESSTQLLTTNQPYEPQIWSLTCKDGSVKSILFHYTRFNNTWLTILDDVTLTEKQKKEIAEKNNELLFINRELKETTMEYEALNEELNALNQELNAQNTEFQLLNKELAQGKRKYKGLFNSFLDIYYESNLKGEIEVVTPSIKSVLGYTQQELIGERSGNLLYKNLKHKTKLLYNLKKYNEIRGFSSTLLKKDGTKRICEANITWRYNEEGEITGTKGTIRDITEYNRIEKRIFDRELLLSTLFNSMREGMILYNKQGGIEDCNQAVLDIFRMSKKELFDTSINVNLPHVIHEDYSPFQADEYPIHHTLTTGEAVLDCIMGVHYTDTDIVWVNTNSTPIKNNKTGDVEKVIITLSDITQAKQYQEKLEELALVAESTINSVVITDTEKCVQWVNAGFTQMTGYTLDEVKGKKAGSLLQGEKTDKAIVEEINAKLDKGMPAKGDLINYRKNGELFWVDLDIQPIKNSKGDVIKYVSVQTDISALKEHEKELIEKNDELTKSNFELDNFVYRVSHDIRSPLSSCLGLITLMEMEGMADETSNPYIKKLKETLKTQDYILKDILDYSTNSRTEVNLDKINLYETINTIFDSLRYMDTAESKLSLQLHFPETTSLIIDKKRLEFILRNLLSNSVKYKDITKNRHYVTVSWHIEKNQYILTVEDNGIGIPKEDQSNIFKMFYRATTGAKGSGLGLYIVKETVEKLGGNINLSSEKGIYTRFTVSIPKAKI